MKRLLISKSAWKFLRRWCSVIYRGGFLLVDNKGIFMLFQTENLKDWPLVNPSSFLFETTWKFVSDFNRFFGFLLHFSYCTLIGLKVLNQIIIKFQKREELCRLGAMKMVLTFLSFTVSGGSPHQSQHGPDFSGGSECGISTCWRRKSSGSRGFGWIFESFLGRR